MAIYRNSTIRFAAIPRRIKQRKPHPHWRGVINGSREDVLLMDVRLNGPVTPENFSVGSNLDATGKRGDYHAWAECRHCDIAYDEDTRVVTVTFHESARR